MTTTTQQLTRWLEACAWLLRTRPWAQLQGMVWGCIFAFYFHFSMQGNFGPSVWLWLAAGFGLYGLLTHFAGRNLPFSERLRNRKLMEVAIRRRYQSYVFKKLVWTGMGMATYLILVGEPYSYLQPALYLILFGLLNQFLWQRTGIDEQNYQPA